MPHKRRHRYDGKTKKKKEEDLCKAHENLSVKTDEEPPKGLSDMPTDTLGLVIDELDFKERSSMEESNDNSSETLGNLSVESEKDSTLKLLSEMPIDMLEHIIIWLDYNDVLNLKQACKRLRSIIKELVPSCKSIRIKYRTDRICCQFNDQKVIYSSKTSGFSDYDREFKDVPVVKDVDYEKVAFEKLAFTLKNPQLKLFEFSFDQGVGFSAFETYEQDDNWRNQSYGKIESLLKSFKHQLSIRTLDLKLVKPSHLLQLLPYLKSGTLEKIILRRDGQDRIKWNEPEQLEVIKQISETEQWKRAVELDYRFLQEFPMDYAEHFKRFSVLRSEIYARTLPEIAKLFSKFNKFERCLIQACGSYHPLNISRTIGVEAPSNELTDYVRHLPIPDSDDYFEFSILPQSVLMEKKKSSA